MYVMHHTPSFRVAQQVAAPVERVWERLSNVADWPSWLPTISAVTALDHPQLALGRRFKVSQPKLRTTVWQVTGLDSQRSFVWESRAIGLHMWANHAVRPIDHDISMVELEFRFSGILAGVVGRLAARITNEYLHKEAGALKVTVEASGLGNV